MKLRILLSALIIAAVFITSASAFPLTITDDYGYNSVIDNEPQTIVSLAPSNTEILFALFLGDKVIGDTTYCYYPEEAKNKTKIGGYSTISIEKITALNPDIIFANGLNGQENIDHLRQLGFTVIVIDQNTIADVYKAINTIGSACGKEKEAADLIGDMKNKIDEITKKVSSAETKPKVMHAMSVDPYWISGGNTFQDELIALAGGQNAFSDVDGWGTVTLEKLITTDPEIILTDPGADMGTVGENTLQQAFFKDSRLASITAVKNNDVYVIDADIFDRGGPRLTEALEKVAELIHPEIFGETPKEETTKSPAPILAMAVGLIFAAVIIRK
ncbi:MAG: cobalamin-binding protein [Methanocorpusculum sp.]|nr:cobalamin-binding protein [Methanocorpusculum sp.]